MKTELFRSCKERMKESMKNKAERQRKKSNSDVGENNVKIITVLMHVEKRGMKGT